MKNILTIIFLALCGVVCAQAQHINLNSAGRPADYVSTIMNRSQKVTDALQITGTPKGQEVLNIVANRYFELNDIYSERDSLKKAAAALEGEAKKNMQALAESQKDQKLYRSHFGFVAQLSLFLDDKQIEQVKDVLTYNVVNVTYEAQCDMIPTLKEAREYAIDAESSKKKHEAFGKYKGRINNYLSKRGYNLTKEREEWAKRVKARGGTL